MALVLSRTPPRWVKWFCPLLSIRGPIPVHSLQIYPRPCSRLVNSLPPDSSGEAGDVAPASLSHLPPVIDLLWPRPAPALPASALLILSPPSSLFFSFLLLFPSFLPACLPDATQSLGLNMDFLSLLPSDDFGVPSQNPPSTNTSLQHIVHHHILV